MLNFLVVWIIDNDERAFWPILTWNNDTHRPAYFSGPGQWIRSGGLSRYRGPVINYGEGYTEVGRSKSSFTSTKKGGGQNEF